MINYIKIFSVPVGIHRRKLGYYFTSSPECSREFRVILIHYLMNSEKVFLITFPSQIPNL